MRGERAFPLPGPRLQPTAPVHDQPAVLDTRVEDEGVTRFLKAVQASVVVPDRGRPRGPFEGAEGGDQTLADLLLHQGDTVRARPAGDQVGELRVRLPAGSALGLEPGGADV